MLGRRHLPSEYVEWNRTWGSPSGRNRGLTGATADAIGRRSQRRRRELLWRLPRLGGPFAFQENNETRAFEYPWAYFAAPIDQGMSVVDLGGSLSGFQFVLSKNGASVTNVDPGEAASGLGWPVTAESIRHLNSAFGTDVRLESTTIDRARIDPESVDRVYSISTLEHIPAEEIGRTVDAVRGVLKPGGLFVLTVDLFLNLRPFCSRESNEYGTNLDIGSLVSESSMELVAGDTSELLGFPEFETNDILSRLEQFLVGQYPALAQALVLRKPE